MISHLTKISSVKILTKIYKTIYDAVKVYKAPNCVKLSLKSKFVKAMKAIFIHRYGCSL